VTSICVCPESHWIRMPLWEVGCGRWGVAERGSRKGLVGVFQGFIEGLLMIG